MEKQEKPVAIVTGSSRGIGAAIATRLSREGHVVVVNYLRQEDAAERTVEAIRAAGGHGIVVRADVGDPDGISALFDAAERGLGPVTCLVNNAGGAEFRPLEHSDREHVERVLRMQTVGPLLLTREFARRFRGGSGRVVNVSSGAARFPVMALGAHCASKAALEALTRVHALELAHRGITVNAVAPGFVDKGYDPFPPEMEERMKAVSMVGRLGTPDEIAGLIAFLASDASSWITGQVYDVNGGPRFPGL